MKIKVCGMREPGNISEVSALKPDYMGFIYYPASLRFVAGLNNETLNAVPSGIGKVAVLVNETEENAIALLRRHQFTALQLHGNESPELAGRLRKEVQVWKAFGINQAFDFGRLEVYRDDVDYFLFDTKTEAHGGSGKAFDWTLLEKYKLNIPFFLSGGLDLENLKSVAALKHPQLYGVDLNSRFELSPGLKDLTKLREAFTLLRSSENEIRS